MKNMSNIGKFFVICAIAFTLGLVLTIAGCAAGGLDGLEKAVDGREWPVNTGPVATDMIENDYEFSSIDFTGEADFVIAGSKYYDKVIDEYDLSGIEPKAGKVVVIYDKSGEAPDVKAEDGRLIVDAGKDNNVYFSENYTGPTVIVFAGDEELGSVKVSSSACDLEAEGVSFKTADLGVNAGDVDLKDITSGGLRIEADAGDIKIAGVLRGITDVHTDAGSVDIELFSSISAYTMDIHSGAGDIYVGGEETEDPSFTQKGGEDSIKVRTDAGDIKIGELMA